MVGEAPGFHEDEQGIPFIGNAGEEINRILSEVGLNRDDFYVTNSVKCRPPQNKTPGKVQIRACRTYLEQEIKAVKPEYIFTLGATAFQTTTGKAKITENRGQKIWSDEFNCWIVPTYHPAMILRNPKLRPVLKSDAFMLSNLIKGVVAETTGIKVHQIKDWFSLRKLGKKLAETTKETAYDFELQNLDIRNAKVWCLAIAKLTKSGRGVGWLIPIEHPESPFKGNPQRVYKYLRAYFESRSSKVAQNGKFDNKVLRVKGIVPYQKHDTLLQTYLLDENTPNSLEYNSQARYGEGKDKGISFDPPSPLKTMGKYCVRDAVLTLKLNKDQLKDLKEDERVYKLYRHLLMPASRVFETVELNGLWVNQKRLKVATRVVLRKLVKLERRLNRLIPNNWPYQWKRYKRDPSRDYQMPFNWGSTKQISSLLFGKRAEGGLGIRHPRTIPDKIKFTASGALATGEAVLVHLSDRHKVISLLIEYKGWLKKYTGFLKPWAERMDRKTSRLYTTFKLHGTVTGRLSASDKTYRFNPQQIPRDPLLRGIFGAPPGKVFIEADYSQVELRVAAFISGEKTMLRAFRLGQDIHLLTACNITGKRPEDVTADERKKAKAVNFGLLYGMWWPTLKQYAKENYGVDLSDDEAKEYYDKHFQLYRGLKPWHQRQIRIANKMGYVRSPNGRIRHLPDIHSSEKMVRKEAEKQAINSPVQGFASDMALLSAVLLSELLEEKEIRMVLSMHDALMFECDEKKAKKWIPIIKQVMENLPLKKLWGVDMTIPIVVDVKTNRHWKEEGWKGGKIA